MKKNNWVIDYFWLFLSIACLFGFMLGARALSVPDEARYTEIPREMLLFHNFVTPYLDGVKYFEKPPLLYWIQAGVIHFFGLSEWALRFPTAMMGLLGCLASYTVGRWMFGRVVGVLSAILLATSPLYFAMSHSITLDMSVTLWLTLTLFAFIVAVDLPIHSRARRYVSWLMYIAAALAMLTKGLIGIALPGLIVFSWLLIFNRWRDLLHLYLPSGLCIFLIIVLPWHVLVQIKNPEFFHFYFVDQHFTRYLTKDMGRYKPFWWFVPILVGGLFPWILFLPQALWQALRVSWAERSQHQREIFFVIWAVEIFLFFSLSDSKLIPYILPVFPPLAILIGKYLDDFRQSNFKISVLFGIFAFCFAFVLLTVKYWRPALNPLAAHHLHWMAFPLLLMSISVFIFRRAPFKFFAVTSMQILFLWTLVIAVPKLDLRPIKPLAMEIKALAKPNDIVASYGLYYQDLPVYTRHLVLIVDWKNELTFGSEHQASAKNILINAETFWQLWQKPNRIFALMDKDDYQKNMKKENIYLLAQHDDDLLVSNRP